MVPGLDAFAGRLLDKSTYFSLPFSSIIFTVIGNRDLNALAVALSYSVAVNVLFPIFIFILLPDKFKLSLLANEAEFLEQGAQLIKDIAKETRINNPLIIYHLKRMLAAAFVVNHCIDSDLEVPVFVLAAFIGFALRFLASFFLIICSKA